MYRRRPSAALVLSRASLPRTSWVELKLRDNKLKINIFIATLNMGLIITCRFIDRLIFLCFTIIYISLKNYY
jgi:hypothetical protein